jgi:deoxyribodipyrimidine photolyase-related protein
MKSIQLILADQLYESNKDLPSQVFLMIESLEEAKRHRYHQYKLTYLFASMREHADYLRKHGKTVVYIELDHKISFETSLNSISQDYQQLLTLPTNDKWFRNNLDKFDHLFDSVQLARDDNQSFLTQEQDFLQWLELNGTRQLKMTNFYIWQRKRLSILVEDNKPLGGSWSYDTDNRKKLPKSVSLPERTWSYPSTHYSQVAKTIQELLPDHPGALPNTSWVPITYADAKHCLIQFLQTSLEQFGPYEDAMTARSEYVFHSTISPLLNNGLLTPKHVVDAVMHVYSTGAVTHLPSVEGFLRQIIGWREWIKGLYDHVYKTPYSQYNYWHHTKPLPEYFYDPDDAPEDVRLNIPLYTTLQTVHKLSWCHHIPRLMILANWMILNEYDPHECYEWFLSQFVDSAEWVMVPNVYGMGLFADGGIFATKPYIGGGNYIKKMSDYPGSADWEKTWTDLYWAFISKHRKFFASNPRMAMIIKAKFGGQ